MGDRGVSGGGMAHFLRVVIVLALWVPTLSQAQQSGALDYCYQVCRNQVQSRIGSYPGATCYEDPNPWPPSSFTVIYDYGVWGWKEQICGGSQANKCTDSSKVWDDATKTCKSPTPNCTNGKVDNGNGACVCPAGQVSNGADGCEKDCSNQENRGGNGTSVVTSGDSCPSSVGIDGCSYTPTACVCSNGSCASFGPFKSDGVAPQSGVPGGSDYGDAPCKLGQCQFNVNGVQVCQPCTGITSSKEGGTPKVTDVTAADGSKARTTQETTTTCSGSTCTTTTKTTNQPLDSSGNPTGSPTSSTTSTTSGKSDVCAQNPNIIGCGGSSFSGTCASGFNCSGDAVLCAVARAEWDSNCRWSTDSEAAQLGRNSSNVTAGPAAGVDASTVNVGQRLSSAMGSRFLTPNCIPSPQIDVLGHRYTMNTAQFCNFASIAGYIFVALATVAAIKMIGS